MPFRSGAVQYNVIQCSTPSALLMMQHTLKIFGGAIRWAMSFFMSIFQCVRENNKYFMLSTTIVSRLVTHKFMSAQQPWGCLYMDPLPIHMMTTFAWASTQPLNAYMFCRAVVGKFRKEYLRGLNEAGTARIIAHNGARGFPGSLGSIHCIH
jgi:hypothetical protein